MSCEVTKHNFSSLLPRVLASLEGSNFVSVDTEFTALNVNEARVNSLFDTVEERYAKLRENARRSVISQVGLSTFRLEKDSNLYTCETFNFFVCPRSFGPVNESFVCQPSSLEFLAKHGFDFNKFIRDGIGYLNISQESTLRAQLSDGGVFFAATERNLSHAEEDAIAEVCNRVAKWKGKQEEGKEKEKEGGGGDGGIEIECHDVPEYVLHQEIRKRFPGLWTTKGRKPKTITVTRAGKGECSSADLTEELIDDLQGFSKVIRALSKQRKVLVGHNCLIDLVRIYQQFIDDLPESYSTFKSRLHSAFPIVFDTKQVAFVLRRQLEMEEQKAAIALASTNLRDLMSALSAGERPGALNFDPLYCPRIKHAADEEGFTKTYEGRSDFHEAGFDAYSTGFCFLKLAHLAASVNKQPAVETRPLYFKEHLLALDCYKNQLCLGRAVKPYIVLGSADPESSRVRWLVVESKSGDRLDHVWVAECLARFGSVDARPLLRSQVLVAVAGGKTVDDILRAFSPTSSSDLLAVRYSTLRHGGAANIIARFGSALVFAVAAVAALRVIQRKCGAAASSSFS